jgi:hypothetical protein
MDRRARLQPPLSSGLPRQERRIEYDSDFSRWNHEIAECPLILREINIDKRLLAVGLRRHPARPRLATAQAGDLEQVVTLEKDVVYLLQRPQRGRIVHEFYRECCLTPVGRPVGARVAAWSSRHRISDFDLQITSKIEKLLPHLVDSVGNRVRGAPVSLEVAMDFWMIERALRRPPFAVARSAIGRAVGRKLRFTLLPQLASAFAQA